MKTNKTYLVRKDITKPFGPDNWYIFQEAEYCRFKQTEEFNQCKRYFTQVDACAGGGDIIIAECEREKWLRMERERAEERYRRSLKKRSGIKVISLEAMLDDEADRMVEDGEPMIIDPTANIEDTIIERECYQALCDEVEKLPKLTRDVITLMFMGEKKCSAKQCAKILGTTRNIVYYNRDKGLKLLEEAMQEWRCD